MQSAEEEVSGQYFSTLGLECKNMAELDPVNESCTSVEDSVFSSYNEAGAYLSSSSSSETTWMKDLHNSLNDNVVSLEKMVAVENEPQPMESMDCTDQETEVMDIVDDVNCNIKCSSENSFMCELPVTSGKASENVSAVQNVEELKVKDADAEGLAVKFEEVEEAQNIEVKEVADLSKVKIESASAQNGDVFKVEDSYKVKTELDMLKAMLSTEVCEEEVVSCEDSADVLKVEVSSEDEDINMYLKFGAESSSSKDESPSGPSCSGTSHAGINSLSSDTEGDLPNINISLPFKKRKRASNVETASCSSCSDDEKSDIDYANLKPDEIKALIEEAKLYGSKRRCKCPKTKWADLPIKGPTKPSGKCTVGKGDFREKLSLSCAACSAGSCREGHRHGRRRRKGSIPRMGLLNRPKARGTIGEDVPIIELSDSEDISVTSNIVTITGVPSGECIVLSSSEDDDDIVCEGVVKAETKNVALGSGVNLPRKEDSPDVVVLNASTNMVSGTSQSCNTEAVPPLPPVSLPEQPPISQVPDTELWSALGVELENWILANIGGPINAVVHEGNASAAPAERPSTPEGWSCPICLEPKTAVTEIMSTTCGHVFCGECIRSAVKLHKKCPTCRKKLTLKQFHRIFL